jgi:hypothetical protein
MSASIMTTISNLMDRRIVRCALSMAVGLTIACGTKEAAGPLEPTGPTGRVRFVNLITDPTRNPVNAILENVPFGVNLGYGGSTPSSLPAPNTANYSAIYAGDRKLVLKKTADTSVTVANLTITIAANSDATVYATGGTGGAAVTQFVITDNNAAVASGTTRLRIVNMSAATGSVDVFVTAPNADLSTATPVASGIGVQAASTYITTISPGTYQLRAVPAGTAPVDRSSNVVANIATLALTSGAARTVIIADKAAGGGPATTVVLTDQ